MDKKLPTITLSDVNKKHIKIVVYLLVSGGLGWALGWLTNKPEMAIVFGPAINYALYALEKELRGEGYVKMLLQ